MKYFFVIFIYIGAFYTYSQKAVKKRVYAKDISFIEVDARNVHNLSMCTHKEDHVLMVTKMEGEYQNQFINTVKEEGTTLFIGVEQRPLFNKPNDKLGAHKVLSISVKITIPEYLNVRVLGENTKSLFRGNYSTVEAMVTNGSVSLFNVKGKKISVQTLKGAILLEGCEGRIKAYSKYGQVYGKESALGNHFFQLKSLSGNIYLRKTE